MTWPGGLWDGLDGLDWIELDPRMYGWMSVFALRYHCKTVTLYVRTRDGDENE